MSELGAADAAYRSLFNGTIKHGVQFISPERSRWPTTYYGPASGAAIAISKLRRGMMRVGVIGLGTGTLAAYAQPGDSYWFYEINPAVIEFAQVEFRYLRESPGEMKIVPGDARLSLERESSQGFECWLWMPSPAIHSCASSHGGGDASILSPPRSDGRNRDSCDK